MKILVTSTFVTPFITDDLTLLRKHYDVLHIIAHGPSAPIKIASAVRRVDLVFSWFGSTYAAAAVGAARVFGRKSMIAIGGADVASVPEIGYGVWRSPWRGRLVGYALRHADRVIAVDPYLKAQAAYRARYDAANIEVLPTGYDSAFWSPRGEKERMVLTVAQCDDETRLKIKGIDLLFAAARHIGEVPFLLVGIGENLLDTVRRRAPTNVEVRGTSSRDGLLGLYRRARVYCQCSSLEGLPNAVCEAMLCGCVPVGTDVGGMETAIGSAGYLVPGGDPRRLADALLKALTASPEWSARARESIAGRFTREHREAGLLRVVRELLA